MHKIVIVADDLSGAADCGIACVHHGLSTLVTLGQSSPIADTDAIAIDADTRTLSASEAAARTASIVQHAIQHDRQLLFKKLDSTLRGHAAAELAAALRIRRATASQRTVIVLAPAFPANGRTTLNGHQLLHGKDLHETEVGQREQMTGPCDLAAMMQAAGLSSTVIPLNLVRSGELKRTLHQLARGNDVLICDAEADSDLRSVAASAITLGTSSIWAGSAGLAHHLPPAAGLSRPAPAVTLPLPCPGPILFVIGSMSSTTRDQLSYLLAHPPVTAITVAPQTLIAGPTSQTWQQAQSHIHGSIASNQDTAIILGNDTVFSGDTAPQLAQAIGQLLGPYHDLVGALVATGGETARAVLHAWDISAFRLICELEPGIPLSLAEGRGRQLPIITKAGAFGHPTSLFNCQQRLRPLASLESRSAL